MPDKWMMALSGWWFIATFVVLLAVTPLVYLASAQVLGSRAGGAVLSTAWLAFVLSRADMGLAARRARQGRLDSKQFLGRLMRAYFLRAAAAGILFTASLAVGPPWAAILCGWWFLLVLITTVVLAWKHRSESPTPVELPEGLWAPIRRGMIALGIVYAAVLWCLLILWRTGRLAPRPALILGACAALLLSASITWLIVSHYRRTRADADGQIADGDR